MDEEKNAKNFELISIAGMAKSNFMEAVMNAQAGEFEEAEKLVGEGEELSNQAHTILFEMLQKQAQGEDIEMNIFAVHAQDHLTMATLMHDLSAQIINLYKICKDLEEKVNR